MARTAQRSGSDGSFAFTELPLSQPIAVSAITCDGRRAELHDVPAGSAGVVLTLSAPSTTSPRAAATTP